MRHRSSTPRCAVGGFAGCTGPPCSTQGQLPGSPVPPVHRDDASDDLAQHRGLTPLLRGVRSGHDGRGRSGRSRARRVPPPVRAVQRPPRAGARAGRRGGEVRVVRRRRDDPLGGRRAARGGSTSSAPGRSSCGTRRRRSTSSSRARRSGTRRSSRAWRRRSTSTPATTRVCLLIPSDAARSVLSSTAGVQFVATSLRERLVRTGYVAHAQAEQRTAHLGSLVHRPVGGLPARDHRRGGGPADGRRRRLVRPRPARRRVRDRHRLRPAPEARRRGPARRHAGRAAHGRAREDVRAREPGRRRDDRHARRRHPPPARSSTRPGRRSASSPRPT